MAVLGSSEEDAGIDRINARRGRDKKILKFQVKWMTGHQKMRMEVVQEVKLLQHVNIGKL